MKYFMFFLMLFTVPASAINTMPNCGTQVGSLMPDVDQSTVSVSTEGLTGLFVKTYTGTQVPTQNANGTGQSRFKIGFASSGFNDPWFQPGNQNGNHAHICWGNPLPCIYAKMDLDNARNHPVIDPAIKLAIGLGPIASERQSTSVGGFGANGSSYWAPAVVHNVTHFILPVSENLVYYKSGNPATSVEPVQRPPHGLRLFAGDSNRKIPYPANAGVNNPAKVRISCFYPATNTYGEKFKSYIPPCNTGGEIEFFIEEPSCVKTLTGLIDNSIDPESGLARNPLGMMLDSPDHKSHTKFIDPVVGCGVGYARIPVITFNYHVDVTAANRAQDMRCSSDNYAFNGTNACYSLHADEVLHWNLAIIQEMLDGCVNASLDCHAQLISPTRTLYKP